MLTTSLTRGVAAGFLAALLTLAVFGVCHHPQPAVSLADLKTKISLDSLDRVRLAQQNDHLGRTIDSLKRIAAKADTIYRTHSTTIHDTVTKLLAAVPESTQIAVVGQVDQLVNQGNHALTACQDALTSCELQRVNFAKERASWIQERLDLQTYIDRIPKDRHWGVGVTCGYGAVRLAGSVVKTAPGCIAGGTWRW